ncbi:MAG: hypothetical protein WKF96_15885 [Solirubrobacteraceae bacterium]
MTSGAGRYVAMSDVSGLGVGALDVSAVALRRILALARYGTAAAAAAATATATALRRHPESRRLATLVATVRSLEAKGVDDT